jgi:hypothetical protein
MISAYYSWYLCVVLGLLSFLVSCVTVVPGPGPAAVRDTVATIGLIASVAFASFAIYIQSRNSQHWVRGSRGLPRVLAGLAILVTIFLLWISVG